MSSIDLDTVGHVATLSLSNPGKLNAIDLSMWRALRQIMDELAASREIRCVVIRGAGEEFVTARATLEQALHYHAEVAAALEAIADCPHPTIAMIGGACVGGGLEIAAACDLRIASSHSRFGAPINKLGFSMYPGEMQGLLQLAGPAVVKEILLEGRILTATEAYEKGLLTRVVAPEELADEISASVARICQGAPLVAGWHKQWIKRLQSGAPLSAAEKAASFAFLETEDYREGLAAFLEKRKPKFKAR
jgi:enoyl-CoA hydratase/carnithine racemase